MLKKEKEELEKRLMRNSSFITYSLGATTKSYESYLSSLGLLDKQKFMNKDVKKKIVKKAHENAKNVLDKFKSPKQIENKHEKNI